jgi:hypothetical protein
VIVKKLPIVAAIALGIALVVGQALLQWLLLPTAIVTAIGPLIVIVGTIYGIGPQATASLVKAKLSPHFVALVTAALSALVALLPSLVVGNGIRIVVSVVSTVVGVLLPGTLIGTAATNPVVNPPAVDPVNPVKPASV